MTTTSASPDQLLGVGAAADKLGARPKDLTSLFYNRQLNCDLCPIISGRRLIPESYLTTIAWELRRAGKPVSYQGIEGGTSNG